MGRDLVVEAGLADAALLAALHAASFPESRPWEPETMAGFLADPLTLCLIGMTGEDPPSPCGLLIARQAADEADVLTVGTIPACRRQGCGRRLLEYARRLLADRGATKLFLEVDEDNAAAFSLYRTLGATRIGQRAGYYESGANAAILRLDLQPCPFDHTLR